MVYLAEILIPEIFKKKKDLILASGSGKDMALTMLFSQCFHLLDALPSNRRLLGARELNFVGCRALHCSGSEMMVSDQSRTFSWVRGTDTAPLVSFCYVYCNDREWV